jgi:hypothetical protein
MSNTQSNDSLRELNAKLLVEICEFRKKFSEIKGKNIKLKNKNAELRQIVKKNAKHNAENAEYKVRIEKLEKNSADISVENAMFYHMSAEHSKLISELGFPIINLS